MVGTPFWIWYIVLFAEFDSLRSSLGLYFPVLITIFTKWESIGKMSLNNYSMGSLGLADFEP